MFGAKLCVHCWEVVPCSEGPLSEVPLYIVTMITIIYVYSVDLSKTINLYYRLSSVAICVHLSRFSAVCFDQV